MLNDPLPLVTGTVPTLCQADGVKLEAPHTVTCDAPGALNWNWKVPSALRTGLLAMEGASTIANEAAEIDDMALLVRLVILSV